MSEKKLIVSLCDHTGNWPKYYSEARDENGEPIYECVCVDLQGGAGPEMDVLTFEPTRQPYGVLAAPPCTFFASSGARWFNDPTRRPESGLLNAIAIVNACVRIGKMASDWWALENPIGTIASKCPNVGPKRMVFDPFQYAGFAPDPEKEAYSKRTVLYGSFNIRLPLNKVRITHEQGSSPIHRAAPSADRANFRSATPLGFAKAFFIANP